MTDKEEEHVQTAIRVPKSWLDRLDKTAERMCQPGIRVNRSEVLRLALHRGIESLEAEAKGR